jgi:hypothetical protein
MTAEEMGRMTLADLEAMAERFGAAVKTIREAQSLLGGGQQTFISTPTGMPLGQALANGQARPVIIPGAPNPLLTAAENAERARLIKLNTMGPDDIDAMERTS